MSLNKFTIQKSFAINAGAGSGKTYTLSRRYINALLGFDFFREKGFDELYYDDLKPALVKEIATITYTEAAALEMKERIFALISKIINFETLSPQNGDFDSINESLNCLDVSQKEYVFQTLQKALKDSSNARISTIHSFCMDLIKANLDIARFDATLDVVKEYEKEVFLTDAIFEVLNDPKNKESITSFTQNLNLFLLNTLFEKYAISSKFRNDFESFTQDSLSLDDLKNLIKDLFPLPDTSHLVDTITEHFTQINLGQNYIELIEEYPQRFEDFEAIPFKELSEEKYAPIDSRKKEFKPVKDELNELKELEGYLSQYKQIELEKENDFYQKIDELKALMRQMKKRYDEKLHDDKKIDFDEIIQKASTLAPHVPKTIKYMMVDEFQDTNELQYQIVKDSLSATSNLFVVGDSKQSIYSFQGAQIEVFNDALEDTTRISSVEPMDINYRSDGIILDNVNVIFEKLLQPDVTIQAIKQNYEATFQKLHVSKEEKAKIGSFSFLITSKESKSDDEENEEDIGELENLANFIANIKYGELYPKINEKITQNKKAIAIIFDSSTKMLELKNLLLAKNIQAKVSASENFFHAVEITDIFHLLKALQIANKKSPLNNYDKYYLAGAYRSCILRHSDNEIKEMLQNNIISEDLQSLAGMLHTKTLSEVLMHIYEAYSLDTIYEHLGNKEQRIANFYKFLQMANDFETNSNNDINLFFKTIQNNIFFNEKGENEALFQSDNLESIEICTIHSTKGLAYPMVILANAQKGLYGQIQSDTIKHNNFTLTNGEKKEIAGFKINEYEPLSFRVLKKIDKLKHLAEKKRLFYVALTRAEHDIVISATLSKSKDGNIGLRKDSYLSMICDGLGIKKENLFLQDLPNSISNLPKLAIEKSLPTPQNNEVILPVIEWQNQKPISATMSEETQTYDKSKARLGTIIHKIFELYTMRFDTISMENIFYKFEILDTDEQTKITNAIANFKNTTAYTSILNGAKHYFELEFNDEDKRGFIDLLYFEEDGWVVADFKTGTKTDENELKYQEQLAFYKNVIEESGVNVKRCEILWV